MAAPLPRKDPTAAFLLTVCMPGAGQLYVGSVLAAMVAAAVVIGLYVGAMEKGFLLWAGLLAHLLAALHAAGIALQWNDKRFPAPLPPPPSAAVTLATPPVYAAEPGTPRPPLPAPPPVPRGPSGPALDADGFLSDVRNAWGAHRAGALDLEEFAAAKSSAIERVRVRDIDEGEALLEAASSLVSAGVLTSDERGRIQRRATQR